VDSSHFGEQVLGAMGVKNDHAILNPGHGLDPQCLLNVAGLDISMDETYVCVVDREGVVVRESKTASTSDAIASELAKALDCRRIVFETGRMAPILFHGLSQMGLPVVCVESRQASARSSSRARSWSASG
jgi:hypothetical protein